MSVADPDLATTTAWTPTPGVASAPSAATFDTAAICELDTIAQAQGLDSNETAELGKLAPLAARSLVQALDSVKVETASVATLETPGNSSGPQGREPGTPADPATTLKPSSTASLDPQNRSKDERSSTQPATLAQATAWVPTIISTRTDTGTEWDVERWLTAAMAGAFLLTGLRRRSLPGLLLTMGGGCLAWWAMAGADERRTTRGRLRAALPARL